MIPGMGGMNPQMIQKAMKQFGIKSEEVNATKVTIDLEDGKKIVVENPNVTAILVQGQKTFQVMGEVKEEETGLPEEDIKMVAEQAGVTEEKAEAALKASNGDIAEAIVRAKE
ncbi:MAG: nascent polypeptide-associated complex protein [archaeon]